MPDGIAAVTATIFGSCRASSIRRSGEHLGVARRVGLRLVLGAGDDAEARHAVILVGGRFGRRIALALLGHDMNQDRRLRLSRTFSSTGSSVIEVVPVDRADVVETEFLEERAAGPVGARVFLGPRRPPLQAFGSRLCQLLQPVAKLQIGAARRHARQVARQCADRRRDRHVVVVEYHDQPLHHARRHCSSLRRPCPHSSRRRR